MRPVRRLATRAVRGLDIFTGMGVESRGREMTKRRMYIWAEADWGARMEAAILEGVRSELQRSPVTFGAINAPASPSVKAVYNI